MKPSVLVLCGGTSSEREVSLRSGKAVLGALETAGYEAAIYDYQGTLPVIPEDTVVFPVLHGTGGEDGAVQAQLNIVNAPYVGSDETASELCFDKAIYREFLKSRGIPVADGAVVSAETFQAHTLSKTPFVLKPINGGSSVDTFIVRDISAAPYDSIFQCLTRHSHMLLETLIEGIEITVGVVTDTALPVIEIIPPADGEFDYANKYNGRTLELCPPQNISQATQQKAQDLALTIHRLTGCRDMSRTDMIVAADGQLTVLETNTIPGMTNQSLLPKAARTAGYDFPSFVSQLIEQAWARR